MSLNKKKKTIESRAPTGTVTIQDVAILPRVLKLIDLTPWANPTPITPPTRVWVVEMGKPSRLAKTIVRAAANSAA